MYRIECVREGSLVELAARAHQGQGRDAGSCVDDSRMPVRACPSAPATSAALVEARLWSTVDVVARTTCCARQGSPIAARGDVRRRTVAANLDRRDFRVGCGVVSEEGVVVFEVCLVPGEDDPAPERSGGVFARELEDAG